MLAINPQTVARIRANLEVGGHAADIDGRMFRPLKHNGRQQAERWRMDPARSTAWSGNMPSASGSIGATRRNRCARRSSSRRLRTTLQLEDVKAAAYRDRSATKLYDRRGYNPEKPASSFGTY